MNPVPSLSPRADELESLIDEVRAYSNARRAPSTWAAYEHDFAAFQRWAAAHDLDSLPAAPETVAVYAADCAHRLRPSSIDRAMAAISVLHQRAGHPSPTQDPRVREVLGGLRRVHGVAPRQVAPAVIGDIRAMVAHLPDTTAGIRDRALLLVGYAGALRRSELVALNVGDIRTRDEGTTITIRHAKTDQEQRSRRIAVPHGTDRHTCPVTALHGWLDHAGITRGPIFRGVDRHHNIAPTRLSDRAVALIIKRAAHNAGLDPDEYSGHSLRAGFATTAAANGATERQIATQTGHKSMNVLRAYIRHGSLFTDNAVNMIGL